MLIRPKLIKSILYLITFVYIVIAINQYIYVLIINSRNANYLKHNSDKFKTNLDILSLNQKESLNKFISVHESILYSNTKNKKIVFHKRKNSGGYGNSLYSFFSALLISILTDSALISDWEYIDYFIIPPLKNVFHKYESNSEFSIEYAENYLVPDSKNAWIYDKKLDVYLNSSLPSDKNRIQFESLTPYLFDLSANPKNFQKIQYYNLVSNSTVEKALKSLSKRTGNPEDEVHIVENLLLVGFEVASNIMNKFWVPQNYLMKEINEFYDREFKDKFVIGMQLRFLYMNKNDMEKFFKCAFHIEKINGAKNAKWFLTGDDNDKVEKVMKDYPNKFIMGVGKIAHTSFAGIGSYERAVFDNELLARSNEILFTGGSTFGFTAAFRQNKMPYCVEGRSNELINEKEPCRRMTLNRGPKRTYGFIVL